MYRWLSIALTVFFVLAFNLAQAQDIEMLEPDDVAQGQPTVINGVRVDKSAWPATRIFSRCTSTIVGLQTLLTAAHCVNNGQKVNFTVRGNQQTATCELHPSYVKSDSINLATSLDYALCKINNPVMGFDFETINTSIAFPKVGSPITLLGFGCTVASPNNLGNSFNNLYRGPAIVSGLPSSSSKYITTNEGAAVCFGDSGGAAYISLQSGRRLIIGVNSRGNISTLSRISSTSVAEFVSWALDWADRNQTKICGLDPDAVRCK